MDIQTAFGRYIHSSSPVKRLPPKCDSNVKDWGPNLVLVLCKNTSLSSAKANESSADWVRQIKMLSPKDSLLVEHFQFSMLLFLSSAMKQHCLWEQRDFCTTRDVRLEDILIIWLDLFTAMKRRKNYSNREKRFQSKYTHVSMHQDGLECECIL